MNCNCPRSSYGIKHTPECYNALAAELAGVKEQLDAAYDTLDYFGHSPPYDGSQAKANQARIRELEAELAMQKEILARYHKLNLAAPETTADAGALDEIANFGNFRDGGKETTGERICTCDGIDQSPCPKHSAHDRGEKR